MLPPFIKLDDNVVKQDCLSALPYPIRSKRSNVISQSILEDIAESVSSLNSNQSEKQEPRGAPEYKIQMQLHADTLLQKSRERFEHPLYNITYDEESDSSSLFPDDESICSKQDRQSNYSSVRLQEAYLKSKKRRNQRSNEESVVSEKDAAQERLDRIESAMKDEGVAQWTMTK